MSVFRGARRDGVPSTSINLWVLEAEAGESGLVEGIEAYGKGSAAGTAHLLRWNALTGIVGALSVGVGNDATVKRIDSAAGTSPGMAFGHTLTGGGANEGTLADGDLHSATLQPLNGWLILKFGQGRKWPLIGVTAKSWIGCRAGTVGTGNVVAAVTWEELGT